jgi:hypothetical protein
MLSISIKNQFSRTDTILISACSLIIGLIIGGITTSGIFLRYGLDLNGILTSIATLVTAFVGYIVGKQSERASKAHLEYSASKDEKTKDNISEYTTTNLLVTSQLLLSDLMAYNNAAKANKAIIASSAMSYRQYIFELCTLLKEIVSRRFTLDAHAFLLLDEDVRQEYISINHTYTAILVEISTLEMNLRIINAESTETFEQGINDYTLQCDDTIKVYIDHIYNLTQIAKRYQKEAPA